MSITAEELSVVIPTYGRSRVLLDTCRALFALSPAPLEILLVDQTDTHDQETLGFLQRWHEEQRIRWLRLARPSIARAMNTGLTEARGSLVLYLDDDIAPDSGLFEAHIQAHAAEKGEVIAGRVIQPWDKASVASNRTGGFDFTGREGRYIDQFMGGNVSMRKSCAIATGGVDENFVKVAYRYERDWAERFLESGNRIWYEPNATIEHLKSQEGGNRSYLRRQLSPAHGVGEYYYLLRSKQARSPILSFPKRLVGQVCNRYHVTRPWWLPFTFCTEMAAMVWAVWLFVKGPTYLK